jgi:GxxExxY protein
MHREAIIDNLTKSQLNDITYEVIGAAIEVHKTMGRGLLESVYHECMKIELRSRGVGFCSELSINACYKNTEMTLDFRCDLLVENCVVVELKAVKEHANIFEAKLLTYMKLLKAPKGILINFNCENIFRDGQRTFVNEYYRTLPE